MKTINYKVNSSKDPSGMGMFSKSGRFINELHAVFRKRDEILHRKEKTFKINYVPEPKVRPITTPINPEAPRKRRFIKRSNEVEPRTKKSN